MPEYEISWQAFGTLAVYAANEDEAYEELTSELFGVSYDGLDYDIEEV